MAGYIIRAAQEMNEVCLLKLLFAAAEAEYHHLGGGGGGGGGSVGVVDT